MLRSNVWRDSEEEVGGFFEEGTNGLGVTVFQEAVLDFDQMYQAEAYLHSIYRI